MPTYDYECEKCRKVFEVFHGINEEPRELCPSCGGPSRRLIGGGLGIIFKGSGFYATDSKRASASRGAGKTAGKTEEAPAGKSETSGPAKEAAPSGKPEAPAGPSEAPAKASGGA
ncbi:MAG: zinc ribbon domain-containing protein [Spirochaetales bacterium]|nr:zinc ribbon domain-containing protein [Spirochaetales bacterium]